MRKHAGVLVILAAYWAIGLLYAARTPAWQIPDEPAHYNVIRQIAQTGALPRLEPGDYDQAYLSTLTAQGFPPDLPLDRVQYQDYQPPLYYLLAAPFYLAFGGVLFPLRLFSLMLGAGVIVLTYRALCELAGRDSLLPLLAAGFNAFIPQHVAMLAGVNNDSLSELLIALGLWLALRLNRRGWTSARQLWPLALVLGLAFVTKVQAYVLAPVMALLILLHWRRAGWNEWQRFVLAAVWIFLPALALGALYWGRNFVVCGPWDVVCGGWHNHVVVGQPTTREWIAQYGWWGGESALLNRFFKFSFDSFWGVFGWMGVFMDQRVYGALLIFSAGLVVGLLGAMPRWRILTTAQRDGVLLLSLSALVTLALYLYYNVGFVQHQGRYLFPALVPLGAAAAVGLRQGGRWLTSPAGGRGGANAWAAVISSAPIGLLAALDVFALYRFLIPALA